MNAICFSGKSCGTFLSKEPTVNNETNVGLNGMTGIWKTESDYSNKSFFHQMYIPEEQTNNSASLEYAFINSGTTPVTSIRNTTSIDKHKDILNQQSQQNETANNNNYAFHEEFRDDLKCLFGHLYTGPNDIEMLANTNMPYSPNTSMIVGMRNGMAAYHIDNNYNSMANANNCSQNASLSFLQNIVYRNYSTSRKNSKIQISRNSSRTKFQVSSYNYSGGCNVADSTSITISSSATNLSRDNNDIVVNNILKQESNINNEQQLPTAKNNNTTIRVDSTSSTIVNSTDKYKLRCKRKPLNNVANKKSCSQYEQQKEPKKRKKAQNTKMQGIVDSTNYTAEKNRSVKQKQIDYQNNLSNVKQDAFIKKETQLNEWQAIMPTTEEIYSNNSIIPIKETGTIDNYFLSSTTPLLRGQVTTISSKISSDGQTISMSQNDDQNNNNASYISKRSSPAIKELHSRLAQQMPPVPGVKFQRSDQRWIARWTTSDGKRACRSFSVNIYGFKEARRRAVESRQVGVSRSGRNVNYFFINGSNTSPNITGVRYDRTQSRWVSSYYENGKRKFRYFTVRENGYENAKKLAIHWKNTKDERVLKAKSLAAQSGMADFIINTPEYLPNTSNNNQTMNFQMISKQCNNNVFVENSKNKSDILSYEMLQNHWNDINSINNNIETEDVNNEKKSINKELDKTTEWHEIKDSAEDMRTITDTTESRSDKSTERIIQGHIPNEDDTSDNSLTSSLTIPGVIYDKKNQRWGARWSAVDGRRAGKYFPVSQYGFQKAKMLAIQCRKKAKNQNSKKNSKKNFADENENKKNNIRELSDYSQTKLQVTQENAYNECEKNLSKTSSLDSLDNNQKEKQILILQLPNNSTQEIHKEQANENIHNLKTESMNKSIMKKVDDEKEFYTAKNFGSMAEDIMYNSSKIKKEVDICGNDILSNYSCDTSFAIKDEFDYLPYGVPSSYLDRFDYLNSAKENTPPLLTTSGSFQNSTISHLLFRDPDVTSSLVNSVIEMGITNVDNAVSSFSIGWRNPLKYKSSELYDTELMYPQRFSSCNGICNLSPSNVEPDKEKQAFIFGKSSLRSNTDISSCSQLNAMASSSMIENVLQIQNTADNGNNNHNNFSPVELPNDFTPYCSVPNFSEEQSTLNMITDAFLKYSDSSGILENGLPECYQDFLLN